jgi:hypothetical protein
MAAATDQVAMAFIPNLEEVRREEREETIRIVEYSRFPRVAPQQQLRVGFTRDFSESGMCLGVDQREPVGSLLRLCVRDLDGRCADTYVSRVVWTRSERDGRYWLGLELITKSLAVKVVACKASDEDSAIAFDEICA